MSVDWKAEWENNIARDCWKCRHYWGNGEGCNQSDCNQRPDIGNRFELKED